MARAAPRSAQRAPRLAAGILALLAGCAGASEPAGPATARIQSNAPSRSASAAAPPPPAESAAALAPPDLPAVELLAFAWTLDVPVHSLAFGKKRVAALGKDVWIREQGDSWSKMPAPQHDTSGVRIHFGRDDQPRLMGSAPGASGPQSVYLRWKDGGWRLAKYELGRIAIGPDAPLFGVLGHDDPEVVCKQGSGCLVKRLTGWTDVDGLPGTPFVDLCGTLTWAYQDRQIWRLASKGWSQHASEPTFERADGLWSISESDVWVAERAKNAIHHFDGKRWTRQAAPIAGPRALWAASATDLWLVGDGGAAHHDGETWRRVSGPSPRLSLVVGLRDGEVWVGGDSGLWQGKPPAAR